MMTTVRFNVPKLYLACLDCHREAEVPARGPIPVDVTVPCECTTKAIANLALLLRYASEKEPFAIVRLQEGRPGMRV